MRDVEALTTPVGFESVAPPNSRDRHEISGGRIRDKLAVDALDSHTNLGRKDDRTGVSDRQLDLMSAEIGVHWLIIAVTTTPAQCEKCGERCKRGNETNI